MVPCEGVPGGNNKLHIGEQLWRTPWLNNQRWSNT